MSMLGELAQIDQQGRQNFLRGVSDISNYMRAERFKKIGKAFLQGGDFSAQGLQRFAQENNLSIQDMQELVPMVKQFMSMQQQPQEQKLYSTEKGFLPADQAQGLMPYERPQQQQYEKLQVADEQGNPVWKFVPKQAGGTYPAYQKPENNILSPSDARVLGVPYGTQKQQAFGIKPTYSSEWGNLINQKGISTTTQAIIDNPSLFDDLTPRIKGSVITELQANGIDTSNLGIKGMSDTAIQNIAQTEKALSDLDELKAIISENQQYVGPIAGAQRLNPWSEARQVQADIDRVKQTVGKALEGGVLRKEDEEKYKKILSTLSDTPETAVYKIDQIVDSLQRDIENYKKLQQLSGKSMDVRSPLQKKTSVEDLRQKYNY